MEFYYNSFLVNTALICFICFCIIWLYFQYAFTYWKRRGASFMSPIFPFGNIADVIRQKTNFLFKIQDLYFYFKNRGEKFGGIYATSFPAFIVVCPKQIPIFFTSAFSHFSTRGIPYNAEKDPLSAHLIALHGRRWKILRSKFNPAFSGAKLKKMFPILEELGNTLVEVVDNIASEGESIEFKILTRKFIIDVIGRCAYGTECNSLTNPDAEFYKYCELFIKKFTTVNFTMLIQYAMPKIIPLLNMRYVNTTVSEFFIKIAEEIVQYREKNNIQANDFMDLLIKLKNKISIEDDPSKKADNESSLTMEELAAQVCVFFVAGFETTANTLAFCLFELAKNQHIQDKLRKEIHETLIKSGGVLSYDCTMKMVYLDKVVNETLRLHPVIPVLNRKCEKDFNIPGTTIVIEKNIQVLVSVLGLHRDPEYYPNPEVFDPERFSPEENKKRPPFTYLPFGDGPRQCIGLRFADLQLKLVVLCLVKNFKLKLDPRTKPVMEYSKSGLFLIPKDPIWLISSKI